MKKSIAAVTVAVVCLSVATGARAGTYDVYACGGPAGAAQNSFAASADNLMNAYSICPSTGYVGTGIVTKSSSSGGHAGFLKGAYQVFEAPPGASLQSVTFHVGALRFAKYWTVGIVAYDNDFNHGALPYGCYAGGPGCDLGANVYYGPVTAPLHGYPRFRFESRCGNPEGCDVSYSGGVPGNRALFSMSNVSVRVSDGSLPFVQPHGGALWHGGWHHDREEVWSNYLDNVGIMMSRLRFDGRLYDEQDYRDARWPAGVRCDFTFRRPCHDIRPGGFSFDTTQLSDGSHTMNVEAIDAAGNASSQTASIAVDNTAPAKVAAIEVEGGEDWRQGNEFNVRWPLPGGQVSPIVRARFRICRVSTGECEEDERAAEGVERLTGLKVPAAGDYTLRTWLEDEAGNADSEHVSDPVHLRFDDVAPRASFVGLDPNDPLTIRASASDTESGLASAAIEMRRIGTRDWRELDTSRSGSQLLGSIDDLGLADGLYDLRIRAGDRAGNELTSSRQADGTPMQLRLPLRGAARVVVSANVRQQARRCKPRRGKRLRRCRKSSTTVVAPDGAAQLSGRLQTDSGAAIQTTMSVHERHRGSSAPFRSTTVQTDASGRFAFRSQAGPSRTVVFGFGGSRQIRPSSERIDLRVPARTAITATPRLVRNGRATRFSGRVAGGFLPARGKLIELEAHYRGRWRTFATTRAGGNGRWRYRYRFGATVGLVTYLFRAHIPWEAAYPFEQAYSRIVRVRVRG